MLSEDFSLQFEGFSPTEEAHKKINVALIDLYSKSPHRSFLKATFKTDGKDFEGSIDITFATGKFTAEVSGGKDIETISQSAIEKIFWQLDSWKANRF